MSGHPPTLPAVRRCVTLVRMLIERGKVTHREAEKEMGVTWPQRTFERDLQTLRESGINVESLWRDDGAGTIAFRGFAGHRKKKGSVR